MNTRRRTILLLGLLLTIIAGLIVGLMVWNQAIKQLEMATIIHSVFSTNTAVSLHLMYCDQICNLTGGRASCKGSYCGKAYTRTPTTTPQGLPTLTNAELTAAAIKRTQIALDGVRKVCDVLAQAGNPDWCPDWYLTTLTPAPKR